MPESLIAAIDWGQDGPWLALLGLLLGLGLPVALYELIDRWAAKRIAIDRVALATRYGGFMNSWAVFGRGAKDYRDLRPMFPEADAAELARYADGTACIVARFATLAKAQAAGSGAFGSFAAAGVEIDEAGLRFAAGGEQQGRYKLGQWLVVEDTLLAIYGPDAAALTQRRRQLPCLKQRGIIPPLAWARSRLGFSLLAAVWLIMLMLLLVPLLEQAQAARPAAMAAPLSEAVLQERLLALGQGNNLLVGPGAVPGALRVERRYDNTVFSDLLDISDAGRYVGALELRFDAASRSVNVLRLTGQLQAPGMAGHAMLPPARWFNLAGLGPQDAQLRDAVRAAVLAAGWNWQPRLW